MTLIESIATLQLRQIFNGQNTCSYCVQIMGKGALSPLNCQNTVTIQKNLNFFSCIAVFAIIAFELSCFSSTGLMVIKILLSSKAMYYDTIIRVANYAITGD